MINVGQAISALVVLGIRGGFANAGGICRLQTTGDSLLIHVGIGGEGQQTGLLVLPAETSGPQLTGCFGNGHLDKFTGNPSAALAMLIL